VTELGLNLHAQPAIAWLGQHSQWYAVQTRSNFEKRVTGELTAKGIRCFLPTFRETHRWKDRKKVIDIPFFPGYSFVRIPDHDSFRLQVLRTDGAVRILGSGGRMDPIPDIEIDSLQCLVAANVPACSHPFLREGAWVRVKRGPLQGLEGRLVRFKNETRLLVSVEILCQSVAADVDFGDVELIRPAVSQARFKA